MQKEKKKIILVTGASSGMGKQTALDLIDQGHIVHGAARRVEKMDALEKKGGVLFEWILLMTNLLRKLLII